MSVNNSHDKSNSYAKYTFSKNERFHYKHSYMYLILVFVIKFIIFLQHCLNKVLA